MSDALAVATHGVSVRYGRETALEGVGLRVPEGAVCLLAGANGAGKSTVMKVLLNLVRPGAGRAEVFGLDTASRGAEVRAQIGYIPEQHAHDYGWMTCGRLMQHVAVHYPAWDHAYAAELCALFDVRLDRKVRTLSKGESRRLQFVLALSHRPPLLLLDEPADGLDPLVRNRTLAQLAEHLADTPTTVLIATHHVQDVESLADHLAILRSGRLVVQMSRDALRRDVRRYRIEVPEGWQAPLELRPAIRRRSRAGREEELTLIGEPGELTGRLAAAGASVRDVRAVSLEEATLAFLSEEGA